MTIVAGHRKAHNRNALKAVQHVSNSVGVCHMPYLVTDVYVVNFMHAYVHAHN